MGRNGGPRLQDWALPGVSLLFCMGIVLVLSGDPTDTMAWAALASFGLCALVGTMILLQKLRRQRFQATRVEVVDGVPIRAGGWQMLAIGIGTTMAAGAFLVAPIPWPGKACAAVVGAAGLWLLGAIATGKLRQRFLQFDPAGLTVAEIGHQYLIAWDNIAGLAELEVAGNPFVGIALADEGAVQVTPAARTAEALKHFGRNRRTMGAPVVIASFHFGIGSGELAAAIATRVADDRRRREAQQAAPALPTAG